MVSISRAPCSSPPHTLSLVECHNLALPVSHSSFDVYFHALFLLRDVKDFSVTFSSLTSLFMPCRRRRALCCVVNENLRFRIFFSLFFLLLCVWRSSVDVGFHLARESLWPGDYSRLWKCLKQTHERESCDMNETQSWANFNFLCNV